MDNPAIQSGWCFFKFYLHIENFVEFISCMKNQKKYGIVCEVDFVSRN